MQDRGTADADPRQPLEQATARLPGGDDRRPISLGPGRARVVAVAVAQARGDPRQPVRSGDLPLVVGEQDRLERRPDQRRIGTQVAERADAGTPEEPGRPELGEVALVDDPAAGRHVEGRGEEVERVVRVGVGCLVRAANEGQDEFLLSMRPQAPAGVGPAVEPPLAAVDRVDEDRGGEATRDQVDPGGGVVFSGELHPTASTPPRSGAVPVAP